MKKWLVSLVFLVAALVAVGTVTAFALTNDDARDSEVAPGGEVMDNEPTGQGVMITIIDDMDPNKCNLIHMINACTQEELEALGYSGYAKPFLHGDPEPFFLDDEPKGPVGPMVVGVLCGDGQAAWITSNGETGCADSFGTLDGEENDGNATEDEPPQILPQVLPAKE